MYYTTQGLSKVLCKCSFSYFLLHMGECEGSIPHSDLTLRLLEAPRHIAVPQVTCDLLKTGEEIVSVLDLAYISSTHRSSVRTSHMAILPYRGAGNSEWAHGLYGQHVPLLMFPSSSRIYHLPLLFLKLKKKKSNHSWGNKTRTLSTHHVWSLGDKWWSLDHFKNVSSWSRGPEKSHLCPITVLYNDTTGIAQLQRISPGGKTKQFITFLKL